MDVVGYFAHMLKTGVVVTALLATAVACGGSDSSRARNAALVAGTACAKPGQISKISKVSVVCAQTSTGNIWYPTMKSQGRAVSCAKSGAVRKKKSVVWVCGVAKGKKLWNATSPLPAAVLLAAAVVEPGVSQPVIILESTNVATPSQPVVADNNVLANPAIPDEPSVTTPSTVPDATTTTSTTIAKTTTTSTTIAKTTTTSTTIPKTTTTATTAPISYKVGDKGPGGGTVFYVAPSSFASTGSACGTECDYLEAAPTGWIAAATPAGQTNCQTAGTSSTDPRCAWSGNEYSRVGTTDTAIGTGYANTSAMILQDETVAKAATVARAFQGGGKTDWFLPSQDELNQMHINRAAIGDFVSGPYWSSSENGADRAWYQFFSNAAPSHAKKTWFNYVRPVRAFSATTSTASVSYKVGDTGPGGGIIFYKDLERPIGSQYFEAACAGWSDGTCGGYDIADPEPKWGCHGVALSGADGSAIGDGKQNTADILSECKEARIAASLADKLVLGGQSDWFLASKDELNQMYLQKSAVGGLDSFSYWTSTEFGLDSKIGAVYQAFYKGFRGSQSSLAKQGFTGVRPVRSF